MLYNINITKTYVIHSWTENITFMNINLKMFKKIARKGVKYGFLPFINEYIGADKLEKVTKTEQTADRSVAYHETGWERIKRMFQIDEFGNISYEANSILQTSVMSLFVGGLYGGVMHSKGAYMNFMRNHEATTFQTHLEAKKKLQHAVTTAFGRGAFRVGWRLALFSSSFVAISTLIQVYRAKNGIIEYVAAGGVTGFMYKFNMGPRGWIVGGGLGSALGLICGATTVGILSLAGISLEETRYWQYQWKDNKRQSYRKGMAEYLEGEDFAVIKMHNIEVGEKGKNLDNLDTLVENSNKDNVNINKK